MKHHWTDKNNRDRINNGEDQIEAEFFDGGNKRACDKFAIKSVTFQAGTGASTAFRANKAISDCGNSTKELVTFTVIIKKRIPIASATNNAGPAWAIVADGKEGSADPCPAPPPGGDCPQTPPQTNQEWEHLPDQLWQGKINLEKCSGSPHRYKVIVSEPPGLAQPTNCP